jgi:hypothetical protein
MGVLPVGMKSLLARRSTSVRIVNLAGGRGVVRWTNSAQPAFGMAHLLRRSNGENGSHRGVSLCTLQGGSFDPR